MILSPFWKVVDVTVSDLVNWTSSGDLRLSEIQRRYVWTAKSSRLL